MMRRSIWILGDQLALGHSALANADPRQDVVLMIESRARGAHLRYHQIKLAMIYAAMRHFAEELRERGWVVDYHALGQTRDFSEGLARHIQKHRPGSLAMMSPNSWFEDKAARALAEKFQLPIAFTEPVQFLRPREDFRRWARGKKRLLMETHYREMRARLGILVGDDGSPIGGSWNYDQENRRTVSEWEKAGRPLPPQPPRWTHDPITRSAISDVEKFFPQAPGRAGALWLPVTRGQALEALNDFIQHRLALFGPYEDMMLEQSPRLFHSLLSAPINIGLLSPIECVEAAVKEHEAGRAPLESVEGFVRQIIGWREFINGVYWLAMPDYARSNALGASRPLPSFFYTAQTDMRCLRLTLEQALDSAYNHHIQRLMILGNFLLLAGVSPQEALRWFSEMYCDAFDWVMAANVLGMSLHADGGLMATKPYAASASYISKMSDYCRGCAYDPSKKSGPGACPFNLLYWDFYNRHSRRFRSNPRTAVMVKMWEKRPPSEREAILSQAAEFLDRVSH
ncbi:MAG: cryptochrome/photolyase family protein [Terrimicrobiaceae bacterium]|nr:cryptochrome/photolyase family protein [Terrimicrobiaceae bacterium]